MFDPYNTEAVVDFINQQTRDVHDNASTATGVQKILDTIDSRVQRRRNARQLLKLTSAELVDSGWTRHDVAASNVQWKKMLKKHGASNLVRTLKLTFQDATEMGITASQLLSMTSDLLSEWKVMAPDMIALGVTVPQLLDRYETPENLLDMGFTRDIMVQLGMKPDRADAFFGKSTVESVSKLETGKTIVQDAPTLKNIARLEDVTIGTGTSFDF